MDARTLLTQRTSNPHLTDPAPTTNELCLLYEAALRAPDHGRLQPYRFLRIEAEARQSLGNVLTDEARIKGELDALKIQKSAGLFLRAPLIIAVIASPKAHPKIPKEEQIQTAACAAHAMILAAYAEGIGAIWRTGEASRSPAVKAALGLLPEESIVAFLYLGKAARETVSPIKPELAPWMEKWRGV